MKILEKIKVKSLIAEKAENKEGKVYMIRVDELIANPFQPRSDFDEAELYTLADSISKYGFIQPIAIKKRDITPAVSINGDIVHSPRYEIVAGERRWRAAKLLRLSEIPCVFIEADKQKSAEIAFVENLQRKNLNFFEEAYAMQSLLLISGMTQNELADKLSISQPAIANKIKLLKLSTEERSLIMDAGLTERHARAITRLSTPAARKAFIAKIKRLGSSASETEKMIDQYIKEEDQKADGIKPSDTIGIISDVRFFLNSLNRAITVITSAGVNIERDDTDMGEYIQVLLKIPKGKKKN